ncbi:hypothetical protein AMS60_05450 [Bacillus sp. FJAT-21945]|nr:hypothetical protein AMS60_05450 [Bacillus sp. FJAT-21945]
MGAQLVAEKVLGFEVNDGCIVHDRKRSGLPSYCQEIKWAWTVVEALEFDVKVTKYKDMEPKYQAHVFIPDNIQTVFADTAPMAICLVALKAVGIEIKEE